MKLKKIASLALAGTMAVSMLAGCATKAPETGDNGTVNTTSSVVATVNGAQDVVTFTDSTKVDDGLEKALKLSGDTAVIAAVASDDFGDIEDSFSKLTNVKDYSITNLKNGGNNLNGWGNGLGMLANNEKNPNYSKNGDTVKSFVDTHGVKDGDTFTYVEVGFVDGLNAAAAEKQVAAVVADLTDKLADTTYVKGATKEGDQYFNYSYTGNVAMTSYATTLLNGATGYFYVVSMTQTVAVKDMPKA